MSRMNMENSEQQDFVRYMESTMSPELAQALEYVKKMRRPLNDKPMFITTSSSEWCQNA